jgi:hypothetical protein
MPYSLLEHTTTVFRVAHRFAVVVMLALCLLAALALAAFLRGRAPALQAGLLALVALVFAVDLRAQPTPRTSKLTYPPIYELLDRQPPGIVAEYPLNLAPSVESVESLYQEKHEHPLFMGAPRGSEAESKKLELGYPLAERTVPDLAAYGVKYVLIHEEDPATPPRPRQPIRGLRLIGGDGQATLYRVVADPSAFTSYGIRGLYLTEGEPPGMRWVGTNNAEIELRGRCSPCVGTVSFPAWAFDKRRVLAINDSRHRLLFLGVVHPEGDRVKFRIRFRGRTAIRLSTQPPPAQINTVIGGSDWRTVSISIGQPIRFTPDNRGGHRPLP